MREVLILQFSDIWKKAFDVVDHSVLGQELELHGLDKNSVKCFESYLENKTQQIGNVK